MDMELKGQKIIVTAGAGGIGLEIARAFVREGAHVVVCDVDRDAIGALLSRLDNCLVPIGRRARRPAAPRRAPRKAVTSPGPPLQRPWLPALSRPCKVRCSAEHSVDDCPSRHARRCRGLARAPRAPLSPTSAPAAARPRPRPQQAGP